MVIKHISFYKDGKRMVVAPGPTGLFSIRVPGLTSSGYPTTKSLELTAAGIVSHLEYKDCDPTITLDDGNKIRVYHAGNSNIPIVYPSLVIDAFDEEWKKKRNKSATDSVKERLKKNRKEREERTTQPMAPIIPPPPVRTSTNRSVKVSSSPPLKSASPNSDPFAPIIDEWFGTDDDPNDGLYENCDSGYYPTDDEYED